MVDIKNSSKKGDSDITFNYTNENMVISLLKFIPFCKGDVVLDAGSGKNKVWFKNLPEFVEKYECEIEDGCDFLLWDRPVDWVIGNPPFAISYKFLDKATEVANKGVAFLLSVRGFNSLTPRRLNTYTQRGFYLNKVHIVSDKRWWGRYYFVVFEKKKNDLFTWELKSY